MNILKKFTAVLMLLLISGTNVFAEETGELSYITTLNPETGMFETREESLRGETDNSSLMVRVIVPVAEDEGRIIYEGTLDGFGNGYLNNIDFSKIDFLQILDSNLKNPMYIIPLNKFEVNIEPNSN